LSRTTGVRSYEPVADGIDVRSRRVIQAAGVGAHLRGFVREVWRIVPPVRSMVRVFDPVERPDVVRIGSRSTRRWVRPSQPRRMPSDLVADLGGAIDDALDDGVQARDVATAGQDRDPSRFALMRAGIVPLGRVAASVAGRCGGLDGGRTGVC
jgi:hypothetical protein